MSKLLILLFGAALLVGCQQVQEGQLGDPVACIRVSEDFPFHAMTAAGRSVQYEHNVWKIDGEAVGYAEYEDEAFVACGSPYIIDVMESYALGYHEGIRGE